ncbi:putative lipoprotein NlpE involved in copper resistance [Dysgonomonas sp. PFB1-18]|uniref:hypothetical protein n=1 Tax=unclassified Dysgonomonas TaxID=2630389 RepID=UPI0024748512|nr:MULTISPECIES: hypothetical protein [unclassified Dysgonomonas]MDH6307721.1 putative lipoprotein NlpE involved in copper resistance [Dysgonomonas sp. PF1-14]MDH6337639.1 putative lipoprotein NlpE involved in copper resistance [Dysgonomonas sp. PF1-16]MDH6378863.1 putative lipoprotein NlpE involved in copper resistance [Dysgonomonas sp. PFB1-18]MDH6396498.1 putative lipoprotein NlpE involved in copper resistance [Dysgonomonas sp. PF1-23]
MKKLIFCCLCIFILMACGERHAIAGRWAMELDDSGDTSFLIANDSICSPELRFERDTIYMDIKNDGKTSSSTFMGIYSIKDDQIRVVDQLGKERICRFRIEDSIMTVTDISQPDKIVMRLRRINENG